MSAFKFDAVSGLIVPTRTIIRRVRREAPHRRRAERRSGRIIYPRPSLASLVAGSLVHATGTLSSTLGAPVQAGDVICYSCSGITTFPTAVNDQLGNTYVLQQSCASGNVTTNTVFTALITFPGTPVMTVTTGASLGTVTSTAAAFRGLSSATPHQKGTAGFTTANPMTVSKTTTVQCMGWVTWINEGSGGSYTGFTLGATQLNFDNADFDANGYLLGQAPGTYALGANFTTGDSQDTIVVLWLPETVTLLDTRPDLMHDTGFPVMLATM